MQILAVSQIQPTAHPRSTLPTLLPLSPKWAIKSLLVQSINARDATLFCPAAALSCSHPMKTMFHGSLIQDSMEGS